MKNYVLAVAGVVLAGCGNSIEMIAAGQQPVTGRACSVNLYQTRGQAAARGEFEELCIINGSSSGSFRHTIANAIEMHKDKACACGATDAFVESRSDTGTGLATVTLIAIKFKDPAAAR